MAKAEPRTANEVIPETSQAQKGIQMLHNPVMPALFLGQEFDRSRSQNSLEMRRHHLSHGQ